MIAKGLQTHSLNKAAAIERIETYIHVVGPGVHVPSSLNKAAAIERIETANFTVTLIFHVSRLNKAAAIERIETGTHCPLSALSPRCV